MNAFGSAADGARPTAPHPVRLHDARAAWLKPLHWKKLGMHTLDGTVWDAAAPRLLGAATESAESAVCRAANDHVDGCDRAARDASARSERASSAKDGGAAAATALDAASRASLRALFAQRPARLVGHARGATSPRRAAASSLLTVKQARTLEVCLRQVRLRPDELARAVLLMDVAAVPEPLVEALIAHLPEPATLRAIVEADEQSKRANASAGAEMSARGDESGASRPGARALSSLEQYIAQLALLPRLQPRLRAWLDARRFADEARTATAVLRAHARAATAVRHCAPLHAFLALVLDAGNELNAGTPRGGARAFDVALLGALHDFRSTDGGGGGARAASDRPTAGAPARARRDDGASVAAGASAASTTLLAFLAAARTDLADGILTALHDDLRSVAERTLGECRELHAAPAACLAAIVREMAAHPVPAAELGPFLLGDRPPTVRLADATAKSGLEVLCSPCASPQLRSAQSPSHWPRLVGEDSSAPMASASSDAAAGDGAAGDLPGPDGEDLPPVDGDRFLAVMTPLVDEATRLMLELDEAWTEHEAAIDALCTFYALRPYEAARVADSDETPLRPFFLFVQQLARWRDAREGRARAGALPEEVRRAVARRARLVEKA